MTNFFYWNIFKQLVYADLIVFKELLWDKLVNVTIWTSLTIGIMAYIMPFFGLPDNFGPFQLAGALGGVSLWELYAGVVDLVTDFEGDRVINYALTLPIPSWLTFLSKAAYYAIVCCFLSLVMLPIGKIVLWNQLDLLQISYLKLILIIIVQNIFFASFTIITAAIIKNMTKLGDVWARFIFPMWFLGGFQFSWMSLYAVVPLFAFFNLINPMIYITEATRAAMLGQVDYLNFWLCLCVVLIYAVVFFMLGVKILKKRLDCL